VPDRGALKLLLDMRDRLAKRQDAAST